MDAVRCFSAFAERHARMTTYASRTSQHYDMCRPFPSRVTTHAKHEEKPITKACQHALAAATTAVASAPLEG